MREEFEKWAKECGFDTSLICLKDRMYSSLETEAVWKAWQAAVPTHDKLRKAAKGAQELLHWWRGYAPPILQLDELQVIENLSAALEGK